MARGGIHERARPLAHPGPRCTLRDCARRSARPGGCTLNADGTAVKRSIGRQTRCNDRKLRKGPTATCDLTTPPGCAGTLVTDGVALAYGPNNPAGTAVDAHAVKAQLACQRRIGRGVSGYVGTKLTDDQRWDTTDGTRFPSGAFVMPRTRAELADKGVEFTQAFMTTPLCCPSYNRTILLFTSDSEMVRRIHQVRCRLDDIAGSRRPA